MLILTARNAFVDSFAAGPGLSHICFISLSHSCYLFGCHLLFLLLTHPPTTPKRYLPTVISFFSRDTTTISNLQHDSPPCCTYVFGILIRPFCHFGSAIWTLLHTNCRALVACIYTIHSLRLLRPRHLFVIERVRCTPLRHDEWGWRAILISLCFIVAFLGIKPIVAEGRCEPLSTDLDSRI